MGGKTSTTTQSTQIPREVLDRYRAVNVRAEQVAQQPFQQYGGQFVAGLTPTQQAGIAGTSQAANLAQPYYGAAAGLTLGGAQDVGPLTQGQIGYYQNPFTEAVAAPTYQALRQQQQQEMAGQTANAIRSGAFGGDRSGLVAANLARQQQLGTAQAMAPIYQQGYQQAVQTAAGQQGVVAQDLARRMQAGQQLAGLGTGAQAAALQGAQAQLAAGTAEQQTQQADLTARYQQFLQERGYPFQVAQFLANIAMGTGALSGSTTTTTQPAGFFSDERLKKDAVRIGETDEGVPIYSFRYKGDDGPKQIGLMAQDVEQVHPEAVGLAAAADGRYYKTVDYEKATERPHREYGGGLDLSGADENWMGGAVGPDSGGEMYARGGYVAGGLVSPQDIQAILAAQREAFGPFSQAGLYGGQGAGAGAPGGRGIVPEAKLPVPRLATPSGAGLKPPTSGFQEAANIGKNVAEIYKTGKDLKKGYEELSGWLSGKAAGGAVDDENEIDPYEISKDPIGDVVKAGRSQIRELPKPGQPPGAPKSGLSEITDLAKAGSALYSLGSTAVPAAAEGLSALLALLPFSDERMKSNVAPVGETYEGQTIYKYNLGDGPTQIGLMAQESRKDAVHKDGLGLLHLDYDKATEGSKPFAYGGLVPRSRYADGGSSIDADLPAEGAMEVQRLENPLAASIRKTAEEIGVSPVDLATAISYETAGTFDPWKRGPTTKWGEHRGLIQWGEPQRAQYGVSERSTPAEQMTAVGQYLRDRGVQPGMGLRDIYSAINAGRVGRYGATDEPAGGAPGTVAQKVAGMGGHRAKAARFLGMNSEDLSVEGAQESGPVTLGEAAGRKAGEYAGVPAKSASLGDIARSILPEGTPTSEKFWVPALGFLGSMLASKSPTLGQAIGEGLVGGVSAYTGLEKERAGIGKTQEETRALAQRTDLELVDRLLKFNQVRLARGQPPITSLDEFKKKLADGSIIEQTGQVKEEPGRARTTPSTTAPSATAPSAPSGGAEGTTPTPSRAPLPPDATDRALAAPNVQRSMSQIDWGNVADSHNIPKIQEELRITSQLAQTAVNPEDVQKYQERQAALRGEINKILESRQLVLKDGSIVVPPEWQRVANQIEAQKVTAAKDAERFAGIQDNMERMQDAAPEILQRWNKMGEILQRFATDPAANIKTYAPAIASAVGISVDPEKLESRADFERFVKAARDQLFGRLQEVGGRILVSEIQRMQESITDPTLQPASNRSLIAQGKALTEYHQAFYDAFRDWKRENPYATADDFASFRRNWQKENKLREYTDRAEANTPVRGDIPVPDKRKEGWLYIVDDPAAKRIYPRGFIGKWENGDFTIVGPAP